MEHRMNTRKAMQLPLAIQVLPSLKNNSIYTVTQDIGLNGACIEKRSLDIQKGVMVRLTLKRAPNDSRIIDALVVRIDNRGAGLMFAYYDSNVFDYLADLLEPNIHQHFPVLSKG